MKEIRETLDYQTQPTLWGDDSPLSEKGEKVAKAFVPMSGEANTAHGEILRRCTNLYYDLYNNGGGNESRLTPMRWDEVNEFALVVYKDTDEDGYINYMDIKSTFQRFYKEMQTIQDMFDSDREYSRTDFDECFPTASAAAEDAMEVIIEICSELLEKS